MSRVGFVMLAHTRLARAAELAAYLVRDCAPVTVHIDRRVAPRQVASAAFPAEVALLQTRAPDWGRFSLIEATLDAVRDLLARAPDVSHICLISGADLPIRPMEDLMRHLAADPDRDHIESVSTRDHRWVVDGLADERATLYHPFSYRTAPDLFSLSVEVQRVLRVRRRLPVGLELHLGTQWWCLSAWTLRSLLDSPDLRRWCRFFRPSWIPDESFFQTLVRHLRPGEEPGPSLHLNHFNARGRPCTFHDDHLAVLERSDHFFARKIDPDASGLYARFLEGDGSDRGQDSLTGAVDEAFFEAALGPKALASPGVIGAHRLPVGTTATRSETAAPYFVLCSSSAELLAGLYPHFASRSAACAFHGRLFQPDLAAQLEGGGQVWAGNIPANPDIRDDRPAQYLANVVRQGLPRTTVFLLGPEDDDGIRLQLCIDGNARLVLLDKPDAAEALLARLRLPAVLKADRLRARPKRRKKHPPSPLWSWHRRLDPDELHENLVALEKIIVADPLAPDGWVVGS